MTALLALLGMILVGLASPRQAHILFGRHLGPAGRRSIRLAGAFFLVGTLAASLTGDDRPRHFIEYMGLIMGYALAIGLALTVATGWFARR